MKRNLSRWLLGLFFIIAGTFHFLFITNYIEIMPAWLPWHRALVVTSGLCEMAGGLGVLWHVTRRWAGYGLMALCVAVLPANVQMLLNAQACACIDLVADAAVGASAAADPADHVDLARDPLARRLNAIRSHDDDRQPMRLSSLPSRTRRWRRIFIVVTRPICSG